MNTRTFYDRISGAYDLLSDASESACRDNGLRMLALTPGERVLEVGCGTGHVLAALATSAGPTGAVVGVDISSGMLSIARRRIETLGLNTITLARNDARALCFQDTVFDAAFMSFTLELFDANDIVAVLAEIRRVLTPVGRLVVVAMATSERSNVMTDLYRWLHHHFPHIVDCRPISLTDLVSTASFVAVDEHRMSMWGLSVACVAARRSEAAAIRRR